MGRFKIVLLEHGYASSQTERDYVESQGGVFLDCDQMPIEQALEQCRDADGVLVRRIQLTRDLLTKYFSNVKIIVRYGIGVDNIDPQAATELGIILSRLPGYCIEDVSDHAVAMMLSLNRALLDRDQIMRQGGWEVKRSLRVQRFKEMTVGLVGFGQIGQATARKLKSWDGTIIAYDPYIDQSNITDAGVEAVGFDELLSRSDYVSLHLPLLPENRHLFSTNAFARMKQSACIINTSRGGMIDTKALLQALDNEQIHAAALDVYEQEPPDADDPVRHHPRLLLTDHCAWYSEQSQYLLQSQAAEQVVLGAIGKLPEAIANPEALERLGRADEWPGDVASAWMARRQELLQETGLL